MCVNHSLRNVHTSRNCTLTVASCISVTISRDFKVYYISGFYFNIKSSPCFYIRRSMRAWNCFCLLYSSPSKLFCCFLFSERFAQSLEILEPEEEEVSPSPLPSSHSGEAHLTSDLDLHESQEVEVQVLESGTSGLTTMVPLQRPRGRGKGRKQSKLNEDQQPQSPYSVYEEQNVVSDGEFEIPPLVEDPGSEVIVSHSEIVGMDSDQVEASEAAQNLALLASQSIASSTSLPTTFHHQSDTMTDNPFPVCEVTISLVNSAPPSSLATWEQSPTPPPASPSDPPSPSAEQNVSSEIVAVAEVMSSAHDPDNTLTSNILPSSNIAEVSIVGVGTQTESRGIVHDVAGPAGDVILHHTSPKTAPESLRRSRRKIARARKLMNEDSFTDGDEAPETSRRSSARLRGVYVDYGFDDSSSIVEDDSFSPPLAKRTRSKAVARMTEDGAFGESDEEGVVYESGWGHPTEWGVAEVGEFIARIPHCSVFKEVFEEHVSKHHLIFYLLFVVQERGEWCVCKNFSRCLF